MSLTDMSVSLGYYADEILADDEKAEETKGVGTIIQIFQPWLPWQHCCYLVPIFILHYLHQYFGRMKNMRMWQKTPQQRMMHPTFTLCWINPQLHLN